MLRKILALSLIGISLAHPAAGWSADSLPPAVLTSRDLGNKLLASERVLKKTIEDKTNPEAALAETYDDLQKLCAQSFEDLTRDHERYAAAEARTNIIGNFITLLSVVTAYAPGKTILAGIGMASGSPGSVASSTTQFFSNKASADKSTLERLRTELDRALDRYDVIVPATDLLGTRRFNILSRAKGICLGLTPEEVPPGKAGG